MFLKIDFKSDKTMKIEFKENNQRVALGFAEITQTTEYIGGEKYDGDYIVTPKVVGQTLPTKDRVLTDDVTVKAIPFFNVSNTSGGSTVFIAKEI